MAIITIAVLFGGLIMVENRGKLPDTATPQPVQPNTHPIGGERDEHGCLGPAGYSWCEAKQACIRVWEQYCTAAAPKEVVFACDESKTIAATFFPTDDKFVDLQLSDGRNLTVPHAMSGSGARYAKEDESFVFWNKGDTAFITETEAGKKEETTFANCVLPVQ